MKKSILTILLNIQRFLLLATLFISNAALTQVIGSSDNSDLIPSKIEASSLTGGGYSGDVNVFNGSYSSTYPLGSVSTPGGLSYSVVLNYSPSYSVGESPSVCSGVPYGEGWHVNIPMITVSNAAYFPFLESYECNVSNNLNANSNYFTNNDTINGIVQSSAQLQGDIFWFSPVISIPQVGSGRAVFKYIDQDDANCVVFEMNKFERHIEARYYGNFWIVIDDAGNNYRFSTSLVTYRSPNNQRVLNYNPTDVNDKNQLAAVNEANDYGGYQKDVLNVTEPKQAFTSWYCDVISNKNIPNQVIDFDYEKFGEFNYFQEFEQPFLQNVISDKLRNTTFSFVNEYKAYSDLFLKRVTSKVLTNPFEILEMDYSLIESSKIPSRLLDPRDPDVYSLDSLYSYQSVYHQGGSDSFVDWNRYYHGMSDSAEAITGETNLSISNSNPFLTFNNGTAQPGYVREFDIDDNSQLPFAHGFLESPRILDDGNTLIPGDIYEIKTKILDGNGNSNTMGNGTVDINIATGAQNLKLSGTQCVIWEEDPDNYTVYHSGVGTPDTVYALRCKDTVGSVVYEPFSYDLMVLTDQPQSDGVYPIESYEDTRAGSVFSTYNQSVKWHLTTNNDQLNTSNFFVMPNVPRYNQGVSIQVGPGNSDTEYGTIDNPTLNGTQGTVVNGQDDISAYLAYAHMNPTQGTSNDINSFDRVSPNFGIGLPWAQVAPLYIDGNGGMPQNFPNDAQTYEFWFNTGGHSMTHSNQPTKFNEQVLLDEVELVRYSKSPYMLKSAKVYRVNGELSTLNDSLGKVLISNHEMDYSVDGSFHWENLNYRIGESDTLIPTTNQVYTYTLTEIKNIPVSGWTENPSVVDSYSESEILQTDFEYGWYGPNASTDIVNFDEYQNPGRQGRLLTRIVDQLGGETKIDYYPYNSASNLAETSYLPISGCAKINQPDPIINPAGAKSIYPSVHFITRFDEHNNIDSLISINPVKKWEYVYDTTQIVFQTTDYVLPAKFRNGYKQSFNKGFARAWRKEPVLETGEQPYTYFHHIGNKYPTGSSTIDLPTIEEYLFFGRPDSIIKYNSLGEIEEMSLMTYDYTLAYMNGYERPNFNRENLLGPLDYTTLGNEVTNREYEYADYYRNEQISYNGLTGYEIIFSDQNFATNLTFTFSDNTTISEGTVLAVTNEFGGLEQYYPLLEVPLDQLDLNSTTGTIYGAEAKAIILQNGYIGANWGGPVEKAAFLEAYFYNDLKSNSSNPEFYFHSYFVKTSEQRNRVYDDYCEKDAILTEIAIPDGPSIVDDPFGPPYSNPISHSGNQPSTFTLIATHTGDGSSIKAQILSNSPLSETNLLKLLDKAGQFNSLVIHDVLAAQPALSYDVMVKFLQKSSLLLQSHSLSIIDGQPYISDNVQTWGVINSSSLSPTLLSELYKTNSYLSNSVILDLITLNSRFPSTVLRDVLLLQNQLSESILLELVDDRNPVDGFVVESVLSNQPILTDAILFKVVQNPKISSRGIKNLLIDSRNYPSDATLIELMNQNVLLESDLSHVLLDADRVLGNDVVTLYHSKLSLELADQVDLSQEFINPYELYCNNILENRKEFIETVTEYDYYEANYDGATLSEGYKQLLGLTDIPGRTINQPFYNGGVETTLSTIELKHEPSWQLYKTKSYSPHYLGAYSETEYFYYYDQLNRINRHAEYYDWSSGKFVIDTDPSYYYDTSFVYNVNWPADFALGSNANDGKLPLTEGAQASQRNDVRNIAFQSTTRTKNNIDSEPLMRSEYFVYSSRWNPTINALDSLVQYAGSGCPSTNPSPCENDLECADCFVLKYDGSIDELYSELPYGYCLYFVNESSGGGSYYACPLGTQLYEYDVANYDLIDCYPQIDSSSSGGPKLPSQEQALDKAFYLKQVVVQIDSLKNDDFIWDSKKTDLSNHYILDFYLGDPGDLDSLARRKSYANYPFDTLTVRTIDKRNQWAQIELEHNTTDIFTRYYYNTPISVSHINTNNTNCEGFGNYNSTFIENLGMPNRITVGYGRVDSLSTQYEYYPNYAIKKIIDPNGYALRYEYDDYDRLKNTYENERLLSSNNYEYWNRNVSLDFLDRTNENYVETYLYNGPIVAGDFEGEHIRAFIDPLGRNYSTTTSIDGDSTQVHSGTLAYDNWSRVVQAFKPYKLSNQPILNRSQNTAVPFTQNKYENNHKSRVLRNAKYGISNIMDMHTVKQEYKIINKVILGCELHLSQDEVELLVNPDYSGNIRYLKSTIEDEDGKTKSEYFNAVGQKVATLQYGVNLNDLIVTLYAYDSHGNLTKVINPEKQETTYEYNILGQLIRETTVDAGEHKFMYNKLGLVSVEHDAQGRSGELKSLGDTETTPFYRTYEYDDYGRLLEQRKQFVEFNSAGHPISNSSNIDVLFYVDTVSGDINNLPSTGEQSYFEYTFSNQSTYDWSANIFAVSYVGSGPSSGPQAEEMSVLTFLGDQILEKDFSYGVDTALNTLGKINSANSYNQSGLLIQNCVYTYNQENRLSTEITTFNPDGLVVNPSENIITKISYEAYNYRGSLLTQNIDVYNDGYLDFQYHYVYDDWNRLVDVYANFVDSKAAGNRLAHYEYDDALGLLTVTEHFDNGLNCKEQLATTTQYSYDVRDRLTSIQNELLTYHLYYDDNNPSAFNNGEVVVNDNNWNGNINGVYIDYHLDGPQILNPSGPAGIFDEETIYGYQYDLINRLYRADAIVGDLTDVNNTLTFDIGNVMYNFDKIGNFTNLSRTTGVNGNLLEVEEWNYQYASGTNKLISLIGQNTNTSDRNYTYDNNGNLLSDDFRSLSGIEYSRATYPYHITKGSTEIDYLYSTSDLRMYKKTLSVADTTEEYYLKSSGGRDCGILDMESGNWVWYVNGADRIAKVIPNTNQQPESISSSTGIFDNSINEQFYLYDHLGNTKIVYSAHERLDTCGVVEFNIEYVGDHYTYGKILREYSNGQVEKFLTTKHERDLETGLDYRGARFYDSDIARFLSLDPLAADYPSQSDYSYVLGNPVVYLDPTGAKVEDIYSVDDKGNLTLEKKTNHNFDIIHKRDKDGKHVEGSVMIVRDKSILPSLSKYSGEYERDYLGNNYFAYFGSSENKEEIMKLFYYFAENTMVEWSVAGYRENNSNTEYWLGTFHDEARAPGESQKMDEKFITFMVHIHPGEDGTKGGSGDDGNVYRGDMATVTSRAERFKEYGVPLFEHYVYHQHSKNLYQYTPTASSIFIKHISSYKSLMFLK